MSVINDMLRDLEARKAPEREALAGSSRSLVAAAKPSFWARNKLVLSLGLLVLLLALSLAWLLLTPKVSELPTADASSVATQTLPKADLLAQQPPEQTPPQSAVAEPVLSDQVPNSTVEPKAKVLAQDLAEQPRLSAPRSSSHNRPNNSVKAAEVAAPADQSVQPLQAAKPLKPQPQVKTSVQKMRVPERQSKPALAEAASAKAEKAQEELVARQNNSQAPTDAPSGALAQALEAPEPALAMQRNDVTLTPQARDQAEAERIRKLYNAGERQAAEQAAYAFITTREQHEQTQLVLATQLLAQQSLAPLAALLAEVDADSLPALRMVKARWYAQGDQLALGARLLAQNLPEVAEHADYHALLASYYQQLGRYERAVERYSSLLESNPNQAPWWVGMAISLDRLTRYEDAALAYRQALALPSIPSSLAQFARQRLEQLNASGTL